MTTSFRPLVSRGNFIAGSFRKLRNPDGVLVRKSPADFQDHIGEFSYQKNQVEEAVQASQKSQLSWGRQSVKKRIDALYSIQTEIRRRKDTFCQILAREIGKPLWEAKEELAAMIAKVDTTLKIFRQEQDLANEELSAGKLSYKPHGVVAVLGTFCFPGHLSNGHILPAILAGNTVIFKPSELSPASGQILAEIFSAAKLPKGVFNLIQGDASVGKSLVAHPGIDVVCVNGSFQTISQIKKATLEQPQKLLVVASGAKNAAIIDADANLIPSVQECVFAAYVSAGQRCSALSRILVHKKIEEEFLEKFSKLSRQIRVGYPFDPAVFLGPLISEKKQKTFLRALRNAEQLGAEKLFGGESLERSREGFYVKPSAHRLSNANLAPEYAKEELFGPNVSIQSFSELDEAILEANNTPYGLALSYFSKKESQFEEVFYRARAGIINWNRGTTSASLLLPFGGIKQSGNFRPSGSFALRYSTYPVASLSKGGFFRKKPKMPPGFPESR